MLIVLDYETEAIKPRPLYPPKPVGLAVLVEDSEPVYYAWGHPTENNCTHAYAIRILGDLLQGDNEYIFHNAPFDVSVTKKHMGLVIPPGKVHDTMLLAFLADPYGELGLKPLAEQLLGAPPSEQEAVKDWLVRHGVCRANDKQWGAYIARAPGVLVGKYAIGDVARTLGLYKHFKKALELEL